MDTTRRTDNRTGDLRWLLALGAQCGTSPSAVRLRHNASSPPERWRLACLLMPPVSQVGAKAIRVECRGCPALASVCRARVDVRCLPLWNQRTHGCVDAAA